MRRALVPVTLTAALAISACIPRRGARNAQPIRPIEVEIVNNLPLPTALTIYSETSNGARAILGNVLPAKTATLTFTPVAYYEPYQLIATRPQRGNIVSQSFTVGSAMTGRIVWTLVPNIIGFQDMDQPDSAATP